MPVMTDEERLELCKKLDADLEAFIEEAKKKPRVKDDRSIDEIAEELSTHPAFIKEIDLTKPLHPATQAIIDMKYETEDAQEKAENYKEDGNRNFKLKKYRWARDNYTEGIKAKCEDKLLNAILYSNRAAAQSFIGNYRSAINDCIYARKFKPDHLKAIIKGAQCNLKLEYYDDTIKWCDSGLLIEPENEKLLGFRAEAEQLKKVQERDARKRALRERKERAQQEALVKAVKDRGVTLEDKTPNEDMPEGIAGDLVLASLENKHPSGAQVRVGEGGVLIWPVLFIYPEHEESDFIEQFTDTDTIADHIEHMFGREADIPGWDQADKKYKSHALDVYYETGDREKLVKVDTSSTLYDILRDKRYVVRMGTPAFILLVRGSPFATELLAKYKLS